jgi:tRNA pseudouridine55 synthase
MSDVTVERAREAAVALTGDIDQIPPMVSAVKIGGRRLHELARAGVEVDRPPRRVRVSRFDLEPAGVGPTGPILSATVDCSSGTYVRTLAADLGASLGGGAHLRALRRLSVGPWTLEDAIPLEDLSTDVVLAPAAALRGMATVTVDGDREVAVGHGRVLDRGELGVDGDGPWAVLGPAGDLLAVYRPRDGGDAKPVVVLAGQDL